jgi:cellulose synthase/poly-beta-1,6-N-acetylglucosamine synthase-like glycosyltransferase
MLLLCVALSLLLLYAALLLYYKRGWEALAEYIPTHRTPEAFLSVVIAARNEEQHIVPLLHSLRAQAFPHHAYEIILVDDFSTDATCAAALGVQLPNLRIVVPDGPPEGSSKKKAIDRGIREAKGALIVATDADCYLPPGWLQMINDFYLEHDPVFIAAPVKFTCNGTLLQVFQALDFMVLQGITAASVGAGFHTMCNGANLAYTRQSFYDVGGFAGIDKVASGDDMLLMHKIWKRHPGKVHYLKNRAAIVRTAPMATWKDFIQQRIRWASKSAYFDDHRVLAVLLFIYGFNLLFLVLLIAGFANSSYWWVALGCWLGKTFIEYPFVHSVARFYGEQRLLRFFFFFQPLHILYTISVGALSQFGKYSWKGRRTR